MPPISACEEEDGSPKYQVTRFQTIAPISSGEDDHQAARAVRRSLMMPLVTVLATPPPSRSPRRRRAGSSPPAISSATRGVSARVETEVAIAFAESWKPLV